ncbi:MAG: hypothetical protein CSYNP_00110 [Syntrophus sp. SKADARSKE-3]|nr:hypothetical protein [Syntrophus sp. SKADARSKE-3]
MTVTEFRKALVAGVERMTAWSGLLDRINVFPVADGDTGRNLVISLSPLRRTDTAADTVAQDLLFSARGNAGNIAARFFNALMRTNSPESLAAAIDRGREQAWQAVADPQPGTMLTFFDGLARQAGQGAIQGDLAWVGAVMNDLAVVVLETTAMQPRLKHAGVVDAGALGMFLFFDGFFHAMAGDAEAASPVTTLFAGRLDRRPDVQEEESGYCVDMVLAGSGSGEQDLAALAQMGKSVVAIREGDYIKVHLHTPDRDRTRCDVEVFGSVLRWSEDNITAQTAAFRDARPRQAIHIMTDAAGSLTRESAQALDVTLLDSYILLGENAFPESCLTPDLLYDAMKRGLPVSTSQASVFERHQSYQSVVDLYGKTLYLCVGSVYTGNCDIARQWKTRIDKGSCLDIIDTGSAAGRLGLLAAVTSQFACRTADADEVIDYAKKAVHRCHEYIFLDSLHYLAAGGRMSKARAFLGDMLRMKPIISPMADGAGKVGMARNRADQVAFAKEKLFTFLKPDSRSVIWLEYTDNADWVQKVLQPEVTKWYLLAEIVVKPLSLTTGVHTGPATWAVAFFADVL